MRPVITLFFTVITQHLCHIQKPKMAQNRMPNVPAAPSTFYAASSKANPKFNDIVRSEDEDFVDRKIQYYLSKRVEDAFTLGGIFCSRSLVADHWIITAGHCTNSGMPNEHGDNEITKECNEFFCPHVDKQRASALSEEELWTKGLPGKETSKPLKNRIINSHDSIFTSPKRDGKEKKKKIHPKDSDNNDEEEVDTGWQIVEKLIAHRNYTTRALSWKGYNIGLIKLKAGEYGKRANGTVAPACLPTAGYDMQRHLKHTYFAGYGRRFSPYCLTDDLGPESQAVCGSFDCPVSLGIELCRLNFLYKGKKHLECLTCHETPSLSDPICKNLLASFPDLEKERKKMHVFKNGKYITTCYPRVDKERGWCAIQTPGKDQVEPEPNKGWGFCSHAPDQQYCNEKGSSVVNATAFRVDILSKEYCVAELGANLAVEQPNVQKEEYQNIEEEYGIFCVADNHTHIYSNDLYFEMTVEDKFTKQGVTQEYITQLRQNSTTTPYDINGRICPDNIGGPVFQLVYDSTDDVVRPVIVGVFNFVPWGTCQGRHDPAYILKLSFLEDWIRLYIKEEEACWIGADGRPVKESRQREKSTREN